MIGRALIAGALGTALAAGAIAGPVEPPAGDVVLTVSGAVAPASPAGDVRLDLAALKRFPAREIHTTTYWHEGVQHFRGVSALAVLESLGVKDGLLTATAADDYMVAIPFDDLKAHEPIFALEWNGDDLAEAAEGPVWLIFPYDEMSEAERARYTDWSIWALERIKVRR